MKLNEIKTVLEGEVDLSEGIIPIHITLTLEQVIRDGKVTNNVQNFIMAGLANMFKNGGPSRWPRDLNDYSMTTNAGLIEEIKTLSDTEAVLLAEWLCMQLLRPATFETNPYAISNPVMNVGEWMRTVIRKQA